METGIVPPRGRLAAGEGAGIGSVREGASGFMEDIHHKRRTARHGFGQGRLRPCANPTIPDDLSMVGEGATSVNGNPDQMAFSRTSSSERENPALRKKSPRGSPGRARHCTNGSPIFRKVD